mmetsp:Transcript_59006/g.140904  ORF Transcript_59006/g.140904 Transcript_59006/m.140904 type:complete len:636 (-) Transcript_59006:78-1985(-)
MGPSEDAANLPLAGLMALAALLPDARGGKARLQPVALSLDGHVQESDANLVRDFEVAGRKCLQQLSREALDALASLPSPSFSSKAPPRDDNAAFSNGEQDQIQALLTEHDRDGDGYLQREEFQEVLEQLGTTKDLKEGAADSIFDMLLEEADNSDGLLSVSAFMTWLSGGLSETDHKEQAAKHQDTKSDALRDQLQALSKELEALKSQVVETSQERDRTRAELEKARSKLEDAEDRQLLAEKRLAKRDREFDALEKRLTKRERETEVADKRHEQELESCHDFWRSVAKSSARCTLGQIVDLSKAVWLGNGKYGYVLRTHKLEDSKEVVVKLLSIRWAHLALKEWHCSHMLAGQAHTVAFEEPVLHADDDKVIENLLKTGFEEGVLTSKTKRQSFPDRWICLVEEFMNRGTVQDWMDKGLLTLGGMVVVMQSVAAALAHMHSCGLTHNDIKPENVLLSQDARHGPKAEVVVKLADLGLAKMSSDRCADFAQFGMTVVCMATGEKFGSRKYQAEDIDTFVADVERLVQESIGTTAQASSKNEALHKALPELPDLLRKIFKNEVSMQEVRDWPCLQGAGFFDSLEPRSARSMERASVKRSVSRVMEADGAAEHPPSDQLASSRKASKESRNSAGSAAP